MSTNELVKRNKDLVKDHKKGTSIVELVKRYGISPARIYYIINREKNKQARIDTEVAS